MSPTMHDSYETALDSNLYDLAPDELAFFKQQTGIQDDEQLKQHIIGVQAEAYAVHPYPCIRHFAFTSLKISRYPAHKDLLEIAKTRPDAIFLDLGCCFGNDARKAVVDGFPAKQAYASDIRPEFWDLGHKLFKSTPESCPIRFIPGDVFDPAFLPDAPPADKDTGINISADADANKQHLDEHDDPAQYKTLAPLLHRVDAIHTSSFFHLFSEDGQRTIAKRLAGLLSPKPGSIIFGSHGGRVQDPDSAPGAIIDTRFPFCHTPQSWDALWDGDIFPKGTVISKSAIKLIYRKDLAKRQGTTYDPVTPPGMPILVWCVTRR